MTNNDNVTEPVSTPPKEVKLLKDRFTTDWKAEMRPEELVSKGTETTVRLRGLQRCAQMAGLIQSFPEFNYIDINGKRPIIQCVYHVYFSDSTHFAGAADVNEKNAGREPYCYYPTSVAESRAEARALRKALCITDMLSTEEIDGIEGGSTGMPEINPSAKAEKQQIVAINAIIQQMSLDVLKVIAEAIDAKKAQEISSLDELTVSEAVKVLSYLNSERAKLQTQPPLPTPNKQQIDITRKKS